MSEFRNFNGGNPVNLLPDPINFQERISANYLLPLAKNPDLFIPSPKKSGSKGVRNCYTVR